MMPKENKFYLDAAVITLLPLVSSRKISKNLMDLHEGVPGYEEKIGSRVDEIFINFLQIGFLSVLTGPYMTHPNCSNRLAVSRKSQ